jgi:nicotinamide mononucleotide transporter
MSLLELLAALTGAIAVWLSTREHVWNWPVGLVNVALYAVVFYEARLYADMGLQVVYFALSLYGWYEWLYGGEDRSVLAVSRIDARTAAWLAVIGVAFAATLGAILRRYTDAALPWLDSALTGGSLVAQFMMTRKLLEAWTLWIAVDVVYVGMFIFKSLYLTAGLYALFLALAVMGHVRWRESLERRRAA